MKQIKFMCTEFSVNKEKCGLTKFVSDNESENV